MNKPEHCTRIQTRVVLRDPVSGLELLIDHVTDLPETVGIDDQQLIRLDHLIAAQKAVETHRGTFNRAALPQCCDDLRECCNSEMRRRVNLQNLVHLQSLKLNELQAQLDDMRLAMTVKPAQRASKSSKKVTTKRPVAKRKS